MNRTSAYLLSIITLASCIRNDVPLPPAKGAVSAIEIEGAVEITIDESYGTILACLDESVDIRDVRVKSVSYVNEGTESRPELLGSHDLRDPFNFILRTYQDYQWSLSVVQPIERYFTVKGQVGSSVIDEVNRRAIAYVSDSYDLADIEVTSLKLGPPGLTSYSKGTADMTDFTEGVEIEVIYSGRTEIWMLYVEQVDVAVRMDSVNPWTRCAWLSASGSGDSENGFRYRRSGEQEWLEFKDVTKDGGSFAVCLDGLQPETEYECLAFSGDEETGAVKFKTEREEQLPNSSFETYSNAESSVFYSWYDPSSADDALKTKWWDSGNIGSTTLGSSYSIAIPDADRVEGNSSALLASRNVVIKFAAGNTFSGEFAGLVGTQGGIINFGRPWTLRPRALSVWLKYNSGVIDVVDSYPSGEVVNPGDPDFCQVWVALGDWDYRRYGGTEQCPVQINTTDRRTFFNPKADAVIAYGSFEAGTSSGAWSSVPEVVETTDDGWARIVIPLDYRVYDRKPTHIIVSFASSKYGDYFTGSSESRLNVDGIKLIY